MTYELIKENLEVYIILDTFRYNNVEIEDTFAETYSLIDTLHSVFGLNPLFFLMHTP
ncbi:MAG: hypothetical protein JSV12_01875 [Candidatus Bathyarchaeota archaeon]|nr:MAG: hypothetical protein JSV12_01875 [Candidatus Bathyarchaeota archaeon]